MMEQSKTPKISVVVAAYNKEKQIGRCIESLRRQTYANLEVLLVDDASFDDTGKICREAASRDARFFYLAHPENKGLSEARNTGIDRATGKYIAFVDGDDWVSERYLEVLYKNLAAAGGADLSVCGAAGVDEAADCLPQEKEKKTQVFSPPLRLLVEVNWTEAVVAWNKLYDIHLFEDLRYPAGRFHEDEFVIHYLLDRAKKLVYTNEPLYAYVQAEDSIMHRRHAKEFNDAYLSLYDRAVFLHKKGFREEEREWVKRLLDGMVFYYQRMEKQPEKAFWQPIWRRRILEALREFSLSPDSFGASFAEKVRKIARLEEGSGMSNASPANKLTKVFANRQQENEETNDISISVIIPVYNQQNYLSECLDSVKNQTLRNIEIICIDDGSADSSVRILNEYAGQDNRVRTYSQEHQGAGEARNRGIEMAKGEYIAFMDSDDWYYNEGVLEKLYKSAKQNGAMICGGSLVGADEKNGFKYEWTGNSSRYTFKEEKWYEYREYQFDYGYTRFIYNREFILKNEIYMPNFGRYEDPVWFVQAMHHAKRFYAIADYTYVYRTGHKAYVFSKEETRGIVKGIGEVIKIAKENDYKELLQLELSRLMDCRKYLKPFLTNHDQVIVEELNQLGKIIGDGCDWISSDNKEERRRNSV